MDSQTTILIVDDEPSNVDMLSQELSDEGYDILTAFDGEEALIKVQEHPPDLILQGRNSWMLSGVGLVRKVPRVGKAAT